MGGWKEANEKLGMRLAMVKPKRKPERLFVRALLIIPISNYHENFKNTKSN